MLLDTSAENGMVEGSVWELPLQVADIFFT